MDDARWSEAAKLAARAYSVEVLRDETTDGQPVFVARTPELFGCMAYGDTLEQALTALDEARIDYIYALLETGLPVPEPAARATTTTSGPGVVIEEMAVTRSPEIEAVAGGDEGQPDDKIRYRVTADIAFQF